MSHQPFGLCFQNRSLALTYRSVSTPAAKHIHAEYVFGYTFRGRSLCRINSSTAVQLRRGQAALLNPETVHEDIPLTAEHEYIAVRMKRDFFQELLTDLGCTSRDLPYFLTPKVHHCLSLERICELLRRELRHQQFGQQAVLTSLVTELAIHLIRRFTPAVLDPERVSPDPRQVYWQASRALEYIHENFTREFSLDAMADAVGASKYYLERLFKSSVGLPPHAYMVQLRLEKGKQLLTKSNKPIAEIALELGFFDQSHFTNVFKRFTRVTPQAFRLEVRLQCRTR